MQTIPVSWVCADCKRFCLKSSWVVLDWSLFCSTFTEPPIKCYIYVLTITFLNIPNSIHGITIFIPDGSDSAQVVELPIVDNLRPRPKYMPQAIPADLAPRLARLHGHPFVWWVGQFVQYLFRPQPWLASDIAQMSQKMDFRGPIVG